MIFVTQREFEFVDGVTNVKSEVLVPHRVQIIVNSRSFTCVTEYE